MSRGSCQPCALRGELDPALWDTVVTALFATAGAAFKRVLNERREQCAQFCACRSGWAVGSHSKDYSQLQLCARGLLGISPLSNDCLCAALKARPGRIVSWGLIFFV